MIELIVYGANALLVFFVSFVAWLAWKRRVAAGREMFLRMGSGRICFHCESSDVEPSAAGICCLACGQETARALIEGGGTLSPGVLERITVDPKDSRPWYAR